MPLLDTIQVGDSVVKIYSVTNRGNDFLSLSYHWAGERKQQMLRWASAADEKKARARARELATAMHNGRVDILNYSGDEQRTLRAAVEALAPIGNVSVDAACREYAQAKEIIGDAGTLIDAATYFRQSRPAATKRIGFGAAVEEYLLALEHDRVSVRHLQDVRHRLRKIAGDFKIPLEDVRTADVNQWLRKQPIAPRTRENYRSRLTAFGHWAQDHDYLRRDVKTEFDALKKVKAPTVIHIFSPDDAGKLFEGAELLATSKDATERAKGLNCLHYLVLGSFPGVRPQEIMRMTDANIRWAHNDIEVLPAQAKGQKHRQGRRRLIPIQPNVRAWLETYPVPEGKLVMSRAPKFVRELARKLKIAWHNDVMRHSAISYMVAATGNVDLVALWSGNSRDVIFEHYLNQVTPAEAAAYHSIMPKHAAKNVIPLPSVKQA